MKGNPVLLTFVARVVILVMLFTLIFWVSSVAGLLVFNSVTLIWIVSISLIANALYILVFEVDWSSLSSDFKNQATWSYFLTKRRSRHSLIGVLLLGASIFFHWAVIGRMEGIGLVASIVVGVVLLDLVLLRWRVFAGVYGSNRVEAEELLTFMAQRVGKNEDPPSGAVRDPRAALETEPGRAADVIAGAGS
jgi:hypothetical protein